MRRALHNANADSDASAPQLRRADRQRRGARSARGTSSDFADTESDVPVIATTSQLLSTGVDLPTVRNIVLFRPVGSMALFKQMIGRGTRLFPDEDKLSFDIIDYSGATALFDDPEFDGPPERVDERGDRRGRRTSSRRRGRGARARVRARTTPRSHSIDPETSMRSRGRSSTSTTSRSGSPPRLSTISILDRRDCGWSSTATSLPTPCVAVPGSAELSARSGGAGSAARTCSMCSSARDRHRRAARTHGLIDADPSTCSSTWPGTTRWPLARDRARRIRKEHADFFDAYQPAAREVLDETARQVRRARHRPARRPRRARGAAALRARLAGRDRGRFGSPTSCGSRWRTCARSPLRGVILYKNCSYETGLTAKLQFRYSMDRCRPIVATSDAASSTSPPSKAATSRRPRPSIGYSYPAQAHHVARATGCGSTAACSASRSGYRTCTTISPLDPVVKRPRSRLA